MAEKFNPAPPDKHATDPKQDVRRNKARDDELEKGLKNYFRLRDPSSQHASFKSNSGRLRGEPAYGIGEAYDIVSQMVLLGYRA